MQCFDLLTGYSAELRIKVNRRWEELENANNKLPQTFAESLRMLANQVELNEKQALQLKEQKPKVEFAESISRTEETIQVGDFARLTKKYGQKDLFKLLRTHDVMFYKGKNNVPYQRYIDAGYFQVQETVVTNKGFSAITYTSYVTGKGQIWLNKKLKEWEIR